MKSEITYLALIHICIVFSHVSGQMFGTAQLVYTMQRLNFEWPSEAEMIASIANKTYIPERNMIAGIKVYKNEIYHSVPRWFWTSGHPVTLAKVVTINGQDKLRPYPNWAAQKLGDCEALQYVQGMEIDPNTGYMYVIDTGRVGDSLNLCPAKIVIYDLNTDALVDKIEFENSVVNKTSNFLNDIVLDYVDGGARYAYITDANDARLIVVDLKNRSATSIHHVSMETEGPGAETLVINGKSYNIPVALDGIAMSPDFKYVYYCALAGFNLYQIPTSSLRRGSSEGIRLVGKKIAQSGGIGHGSKRLYYGALTTNAVYYWDSDKDMAEQGKGMDSVTLKTEKLLVRNDSTMQWPDTFGFDNSGWIWFVSNRVHEFREAKGLPNNTEVYMRVWKVFVNETSYLYPQRSPTRQPGSGSTSRFLFTPANGWLCTLLYGGATWVTWKIMLPVCGIRR